MPPFGGGAVVIDCLAIISLDAITLFVEIPQDKLGRSKTLRGCGGEPSCRFFPVPGDTGSVHVILREIVFGLGISFLRFLPQTFPG